MIGNDLLASPVVTESTNPDTLKTNTTVYLPKNSIFYNLYTGERITGKTELNLEVAFDDYIPLYVIC